MTDGVLEDVRLTHIAYEEIALRHQERDERAFQLVGRRAVQRLLREAADGQRGERDLGAREHRGLIGAPRVDVTEADPLRLGHWRAADRRRADETHALGP